jgi:chromate reductase
MIIDIYGGLAGLPHYNADLDHERPPAEVAELRQLIAQSDGLLIATPEFNYSIPGALKNALDWASRPTGESSLFRKPVAIMGAAPGNFGTVRAQRALRDVFLWTDSRVVTKPEVHVFHAPAQFEADGSLKQGTADLVVALLRALSDLIATAALYPVGA